MADTYTDPADDSLVSPWDLPLPDGKRKAPQGAVTGIGRTVPVTGAWGNEGYFGDINNTGENPGLLATLGKTARQAKYQFFSPPSDTTGEDTSTTPVERKDLPPPQPTGNFSKPVLRPNDVSGVQEQPMGTNALPPLPGAEDEAKAWGPGKQPRASIPESQTGAYDVPDELAGKADAGNAWAPKSIATTKESLSGSAPNIGTSPVPGGSAAPPPSAPAGMFGLPPGSMLDRLFSGISDFRDQNRMTLMAMAGGFAGPHSGIGRAFSAGANTMPEQMKLNEQNATVQALMNTGMTRPAATAFAGNPALTQEALGQMSGYAPPKTMSVKDWMGNEHAYQWNAQDKSWSPLNVAGGAPAQGASGSMAIGSTLGGPGDPRWEAADPETRINSLTDPSMKALATSMRHGGNIAGRQQLTATNALMAQIDPNWNQVTSYDAAKSMRVGLEGSSPSSQGGLIANGMSAFGHLGELGDAMVGVGAYSGPNIPGGALIGTMGNYGRTALATPDLKASQSQEADTALKYGEEGTKFYAATGGGEAERTAALNNATGPGKLSSEKAGYLRAELGLMTRRMEDQLAKVQASPGAFDWIQKNQGRINQMYQDIARTKHAIAQLDPNGPEAAQERQQAGGNRPQAAPATPAARPAPAAADQQPPGTIVHQNGHIFRKMPDGSWQQIQ